VTDDKEQESDFETIREDVVHIEEDLRKELHHHNLFPLIAGGLAVFFLMTSMVVAMPFMFYTATPSSIAHEYTPLEAEGRSLYTSLGCFYCHSQFNRPTDWATGNTSQAGDYVYDQPHTLGTERTGPDLAQIGGQRPTIWHELHYRDPRSVSPSSVMPNFGFLSDEQIEALIAYIQYEGGKNLETENFQPQVPSNYQNASNPFMSLMMEVAMDYNASSQEYTGDPLLGDNWADIFNDGKQLFTEKCLACHGCSGNGQGPYARHVLTRPANLNERIMNYPGDYFHFWRLSEGVPGTAMPRWMLSLNETTRWKIATYEMSFVLGAIRTISGDVSDTEGDVFANSTQITPLINGTQQEFEEGQSIFLLYCAQCHGATGQGDGPTSITSPGGYISPEPANFTESGGDFPVYGRYVWKVQEGVETTNMPPWKFALSDEEIFNVIFFIQSFSTPEDYNAKWAPQYADPFAQNLMR
jgi:cytochrome c oxidase cbb3-type subunit I/II